MTKMNRDPSLLCYSIHMQRHTQAEIQEMLRESGLKYTEHRFNILNRMSKSKTPIPAQKLIDDLKKKHDIDQATVYRNLTNLESAGLIIKSNYNHDYAHYEMNMGDAYHKVICSRCNVIENVAGINADEVLKKIAKKSKKFNASKVVTFEIYATCKSCG